jgi:predicted porin
VAPGDQSTDQVKVTYLYNMSKRTAVYGTASWLKNNDQSTLTLPGGPASGTTPGGKSQGFEFGIRHFF